MKLAAAAMLLAVAGCSSGPATAAAASHGSAVPDSDRNSCVLRGAQNDIEVGVTGTWASCDQWVQDLAPIGLNWYFIPRLAPPYSAGPADGQAMYKVCVLSRAGASLVVEDAGTAFYGTSLCSQEEGNGWVPHESTEG